MRCATVAACTLAFVSSLAGCRGPRDPDLDRRLSEAKIERALPAPPAEARSPEKPAAKADDEGAKHGLPPAGSVEIRTYSSKEIAAILAAVPVDSAETSPTLAAGDAPSFAYRALFETEHGDVSCLLDHVEAPQTTANLIALATGQRAWRDPDTKDVVERRFYDGLTFHRAIENFIIQTGNPGTGASSGPGWTIPREEGIQARFDAPGALGMVDAGEETHGSQFFITLRAQKSLKGKYAPFGVCESLDVVRRISNGDKRPATTKGKSATKPVKAARLSRLVVRRVRAGAPAPDKPLKSPAPPPSSNP